jgi:DNA-binding response OmpR family regulator
MSREAFTVATERGAHVLIVEDNDEVRLMLSTLLSSEGYAVTGVGTAVEGAVAAGKARPDLVIMDLGLPDADGLSAVRAMRSRVGLVHTPILMVTAYDTMQFREEAMEAGCSGYMVKPVDPERLLEAVRLLTRGGRGHSDPNGGLRG